MIGFRQRVLAIACLSATVTACVAARGQSPAVSPVAIKREVTLGAKPGQLDILRTVTSASAFAAVVSDAAGVLAVAHAPQPTVTKAKPWDFEATNDPQVSVFRLDAQGEVGAAASIRLPSAPKLASRRHYPLALAAHPKLPLLYVWQDVVAPAEGAPADDPKTDGFRHLHIYDISSAEPRLVQSAAEGEAFSRANYAGAIAFDRTAGRLFVPNMQRRTKLGFAPSIGYLHLADDGLVVPDTNETAETAAGGKGTTPDRTAAVTAAARKVYLEQVRLGKVPERTVRQAASATSTFGESPCGLGFHNISDDITIVCGALGPVTWDEGNRRGQFNTYSFYPAVGIGYRYRMVAHPTLPVVFFTGLTSGFVFRVEHVDGFTTMLPQRGTMAPVIITSPPLLVGSRPLLVCSSEGLLHLIGFDAEGAFNGERTDVALPSRKVEALAYSAKYDRLYTTVPEVKK